MENKKIVIELTEYCTSCSDGCCTDYGTITKVNGKELFSHNEDAETMIEQLLTYLGYDVEIFRTYNGKRQ